MNLKLLEPIEIGKKLMKNRILMPAMETRMSTLSGDIKPEMIDYYAARAKGGAGAIIVENTYIDNLSSRSSLSSSGLYTDHLISGKKILAEVIKENGALSIIQISHGGRQSAAMANKNQPVAPSPIMCGVIKRMPHELTINEIIEIEDAFAEAAVRAKKAGFDGVEVHGAHGYLICSFLSPLTNLRKDRYGGSLTNRGRFANDIIKKIRSITGKDFIVGYRISAKEYIGGGLELEEACDFVKTIQDNIDYINVSAGIYESPGFYISSSTYLPRGELIPLAAEIKKNSNIPVIAVGSFNPDLAEKVLKDGKADIIAFGRALIADPMMPIKLKYNRKKDIRPCIRGNEGCISGFKTGCPMRCEVNPACGREGYFKIKRTLQPKKVLIIGGGVSGMEAARVADLIGHKVILVEKENMLGGHLNESAKQDFKHDIYYYLMWLKRQIKNSEINVLLNTDANKPLVKKINPDVLLIAIGSEYFYPDIRGAQNAFLAKDILEGSIETGKKVIIVGGGVIGCETALALSQEKDSVIIFEMKKTIAEGYEAESREVLIKRLKDKNVRIYTDFKVIEIGNGLVITKDRYGHIKNFNTDTAVLATGLKSKKIKEFVNIIPETACIGDCIKPRKIYNCVHEAWSEVINIRINRARDPCDVI